MAEITKRIRRTPVTVDSLTTGKFQKQGTITAMLRQTVTTIASYPSAVHSSNMQDNIFSSQEFGDETQDFSSDENRVAFIDVPENTTVEQITAKLTPNCTLYKVLSHAPILTDNHQNAIARGLTTLDDLADSQVVRYGENHKNAGELILDGSKVQYRKVFFSTTKKDDIDRRGSEQYPAYLSANLKAELNMGDVTENVGSIVLEEEQVII